jgi:phosphoglycolate phosphatase-like HAD superfamily hydrolase
MTEPAQSSLRAFTPRHSFFVGIDSDGCVFDTMEIKQKKCFFPNIAKHWQLEAISDYVWAAVEFVNLRSPWRGSNRFPALLKTLEFLRERPEVQGSGVKVPRLASLQAWVKRGGSLGNPALEAEAASTGDAELRDVLEWSHAVNREIAKIVSGIPPFASFRKSMEKILGRADMACVSQTPCEALNREWQEHDIARYVSVIAGQEMGSKTEHLRLMAAGKYETDCMLMIGDAPGDFAAARANHTLFYPIRPGSEEESWQRFHDEAIDRFFNHTYGGDYQAALIAEFEKLLPDQPPWKK